MVVMLIWVLFGVVIFLFGLSLSQIAKAPAGVVIANVVSTAAVVVVLWAVVDYAVR